LAALFAALAGMLFGATQILFILAVRLAGPSRASVPIGTAPRCFGLT